MLANGKTVYHNRVGEAFRGPIIPFGAEITYKPITDKDGARVHKVGAKVVSGVFVGYVQQDGGGWAGDLLVFDWDEIQIA